ncbi:MAG: hypothetical protein WC455_09045 [Dehalococcoidia bacterium]|jgi:hypothetical protein
MKHIVTVARVTTVSIDIEVETEHGSFEEAKALALGEAEETDEFDNYDGIVEFEFVQMQGHEDRIVTDDRFWDCECKEHFIHPSFQSRCSICKCEQSEMPSSRVNEILDYYGCKPADLVSLVDIKREDVKQYIIKTVNETGRWGVATCPGSKGEACGWDQDLHYALEQLMRRGIPGIALGRSVSFERHDWVAVKV